MNKSIRVAIGVYNSNGQPCIFMAPLNMTQAEIDCGLHYAKIAELAKSDGYSVSDFAFDENDPAGQQLMTLLQKT